MKAVLGHGPFKDQIMSLKNKTFSLASRYFLSDNSVADVLINLNFSTRPLSHSILYYIL